MVGLATSVHGNTVVKLDGGLALATAQQSKVNENESPADPPPPAGPGSSVKRDPEFKVLGEGSTADVPTHGWNGPLAEWNDTSVTCIRLVSKKANYVQKNETTGVTCLYQATCVLHKIVDCGTEGNRTNCTSTKQVDCIKVSGAKMETTTNSTASTENSAGDGELGAADQPDGSPVPLLGEDMSAVAGQRDMGRQADGRAGGLVTASGSIGDPPSSECPGTCAEHSCAFIALTF